MGWSEHLLEAVKHAVDTFCSTNVRIKQFEYSNPFSNGAMDTAEAIVLQSQPHTDKAVVEAANEYLVHAFKRAREMDLSKPIIAALPDFRR